jgi:hypothetical protein
VPSAGADRRSSCEDHPRSLNATDPNGTDTGLITPRRRGRVDCLISDRLAEPRRRGRHHGARRAHGTAGIEIPPVGDDSGAIDEWFALSSLVRQHLLPDTPPPSPVRWRARLQLDALAAAGVEPRHTYVDNASGTLGAAPQFDAALRHLRAGDVPVVTKLDRMPAR